MEKSQIYANSLRASVPVDLGLARCRDSEVKFGWPESQWGGIFTSFMMLTSISGPSAFVRILSLMVLAICMGAMAVHAERVALGDVRVALKAYEDLTHKEVTRLGSKVMNMGDQAWLHAETDHYVLHGTDDRLMHQVAYEVEFAHRELDRYFGTSTDMNKGHVFVINDKTVWHDLLRSGKSPHRSMAMHLQSNIFVYREGDAPSDTVKIPHELIHLRVLQHYGSDCPFWAEEGLAEHLGWVLANRYYWLRYERLLVQTFPATAEENILAWKELESLPAYPDDPELARHVKRQVQRMGKALLARMGHDKIPLFLDTFLGEKMSLREGLTGPMGMSADDVDQLEAASREILLHEEEE